MTVFTDGQMAIKTQTRAITSGMVNLQVFLHVQGSVLKIENAEPYMRTDHVRIGVKQTDVRYRPSYPIGWSVDIPIVYDADVISIEQLLNLIERAGFSVGLCEHRPEKDGDKGMFKLDLTKELEDKPLS